MNTAPDHVRLFVACEVPDEVKDGISNVIEQLKNESVSGATTKPRTCGLRRCIDNLPAVDGRDVFVHEQVNVVRDCVDAAVDKHKLGDSRMKAPEWEIVEVNITAGDTDVRWVFQNFERIRCIGVTGDVPGTDIARRFFGEAAESTIPMHELTDQE